MFCYPFVITITCIVSQKYCYWSYWSIVKIIKWRKMPSSFQVELSWYTITTVISFQIVVSYHTNIFYIDQWKWGKKKETNISSWTYNIICSKHKHWIYIYIYIRTHVELHKTTCIFLHNFFSCFLSFLFFLFCFYFFLSFYG